MAARLCVLLQMQGMQMSLSSFLGSPGDVYKADVIYMCTPEKLCIADPRFLQQNSPWREWSKARSWCWPAGRAARLGKAAAMFLPFV